MAETLLQMSLTIPNTPRVANMSNTEVQAFHSFPLIAIMFIFDRHQSDWDYDQLHIHSDSPQFSQVTASQKAFT